MVKAIKIPPHLAIVPPRDMPDKALAIADIVPGVVIHPGCGWHFSAWLDPRLLTSHVAFLISVEQSDPWDGTFSVLAIVPDGVVEGTMYRVRR